MRFLICLGLLTSVTVAAEPQLLTGHDATTIPAQQQVNTGCKNCQSGWNPALGDYSQAVCRTSICQQAAEAGLPLTCCDPDMRPAMELWADFCQDQHHAGGCAVCGGVHGPNCQIRAWGRGCNGNCGLGLLSRVTTRQACTSCTDGAATCDAVGQTSAEPQAPAPTVEGDAWDDYPAPEPPPAPTPTALNLLRSRGSSASILPASAGRATSRMQKPRVTGNVADNLSSGWDRLRGVFSGE